jgi:hypothetical protein
LSQVVFSCAVLTRLFFSFASLLLFLIIILFFLPLQCAAFLLEEPPPLANASATGLIAQITSLVSALRQPHIWKPLLFFFAQNAIVPSCSQVQLKFSCTTH